MTCERAVHVRRPQNASAWSACLQVVFCYTFGCQRTIPASKPDKVRSKLFSSYLPQRGTTTGHGRCNARVRREARRAWRTRYALGEGFQGRKRQKKRFHRIPAIDSTEPEFPQGKQAVVRNWRQPLHRHRFGRHRCGCRRPCSSGRLYGWYRCRCRHRRCTGRWSGSQPVSSRVVP